MDINMSSDTIAAIATAMSPSGIGIVRISGDEALAIIDRIYRSKNNNVRLNDCKSHTIHYGYIYDGDEVVDEVMVLLMKAPNSYTREDTVEIDCHGGVYVMKRILETVIKYGARPAEPGEFTKRAFLNGRLDLTQAESVIDVINAKNDYALKSSLNQLKGSVHEEVKKIRDEIIYQIAFIESALDDPEHISLEGYPDKLMAKTRGLNQELKKLIDSADNGKMLKDGIRTVILGKPNAGKSSLLNVLVGEDKAIVTSVAGTTRDVLEESIKLHGIGLNMIDTAGIRDTEDEVEKIGVEKARKYANQADLVIYVVDSSRELDENDEEIIELIRDKKVIVLLNKTDLEPVVTEEQIKDKFREIYEGEEKHDDSLHVIRTSTKDNTGIDEFEKTIQDMFFAGRIAVNDEIYITNQRHKEALVEAYDSLKMVQKSLEDEMPEDFYSIDLMSAYAALGRIIGEEVGEDLVNEIFSKFCMGK